MSQCLDRFRSSPAREFAYATGQSKTTNVPRGGDHHGTASPQSSEGDCRQRRQSRRAQGALRPRPGRAVQARPAHRQDRPARSGRYPDGTGRHHLSEGDEQHDGRPEGGVLLRRHRRQPGRHQDQGPGVGRARQGRRHPRTARGVRTARDFRLHRAGQDSAAQPRRRRGHDAAPAQSVFHPRIGHFGTVHAPDGGLRRQGAEAQACRHGVRRLRLRLRADGRLSADLRGSWRQDRQEAVATAGHAGLHALRGADRGLRRRLPRLRRIEPATLHEGLRGRRPETAGGGRRDRGRRRAAQELWRRGARSHQLHPLYARSRDRRQQALHRRHVEELRHRAGPVRRPALS